MFNKEKAENATRLIFEKAIYSSQYSMSEIYFQKIPINIYSSFDRICIYEPINKKYLISNFYPCKKIVAFELFTKDEEGHYSFFHAQSFKKLSLDYFSQKTDVEYIKGKYLPSSVNCKQFWGKFNQDKDKLKAAQLMWSTKSNKSLGYVIEKPKKNIQVRYCLDKNGDKSIANIKVIYRKNNFLVKEN
jgi:hypothetical protein